MDISNAMSVPAESINLSTQLQRLEGLQRILADSPESQERKNTVKEAATEFESFFLYYLIKTMRDTIPEGGLLAGGNAEKIYTSLMDETMAKNMALQGGLGLNDLIEKNL